jgi:hypothetical protein
MWKKKASHSNQSWLMVLAVVTTGSDNVSDNDLTPTLGAFPRWRPQFAHLGEVLTLLKLLLADTAGNKCSAVSVNAMSEVRAGDADPLTTAIAQLRSFT